MTSVAIDSKGQFAFYIPTVTYSCPSNTWNSHCCDINILKRSFGILIVLYSVVMILNLVMPELSEAAMNGMLIGAFLMWNVLNHRQSIMSSFDIFMTTIFGGLLMSAFCGTISLYFHIGRYLTKLTFSNFVMAIMMEICFDWITSIYIQLGSAFIMSIVFQFIQISFSVLLGGLQLAIGLSYLLKVGNIHRILVNNFHALTSIYLSPWENDSIYDFVRPNFINYKIKLNLLDYLLLMFYVIGAVFLTIRKEIYFRKNPNADHFFSECENIEEYNRNVARKRRKNCVIGIKRTSNGQLKIVSRCRRRHHYRSNVINERSPLISHWLESDESEDDVFESPNTNSRFMRTLSSESKERLAEIQNFDSQP
jgi:hypothetical protein